MSERMELSGNKFFSNCEELFWLIRITEMIDLLNTQAYKWSDISFKLEWEDGWEVICMVNSRTWEKKVFTSFHDLEGYFLEEAREVKKLMIHRYPDSKNIVNSKPEDSVKSLIDVLLAVSHGDIKAPEKIMPKVCEIYQQETQEIMWLDARNYIVPAILSLYSDKEITDAQKYFWRQNYHNLYALINASTNEKINLDKLCDESIAHIRYFITEIWAQKTIEFLSNSKKSMWEVIKKMENDRSYSWWPRASEKLEDYI